MAHEDRHSDLIDIVHHEHDHMGRLFEDIASSFERIVSGETEVSQEGEMLEAAADELEFALDEMLHHFNQEEEVFFVSLEERFPELGEDIRELVEAHETMCERTRWLLGKVSDEPETIAGEADEILEVLRGMSDQLTAHTTRENEIFEEALSQMPEEEQQELLEEMRRL